MNRMKSEKGFALIETLVTVAILGITSVGLLSGLSTTLKAGMISQERVVAESLAKSQWEHIRTQDYILTADYNPDDPLQRYELIDIPDDLIVKGYTVEISAPQTIIDPTGDERFELQSMNVVIKRNSELILTISDYMVGRLG